MGIKDKNHIMPYSGLKSYGLTVRKFLNSESHVFFNVSLRLKEINRTNTRSQHRMTAGDCSMAQAFLSCFYVSRKIPCHSWCHWAHQGGRFLELGPPHSERAIIFLAQRAKFCSTLLGFTPTFTAEASMRAWPFCLTVWACSFLASTYVCKPSKGHV